MKIYTKRGDDGSTGLFHGGRVRKDDLGPEAYGTVDEAVAALGVARALADGDHADRLLAIQRDLFVVAAELATSPDRRSSLQPGVSVVEGQMVDRLEQWIDTLAAEAGTPTEFVVPGQTELAAAVDFARTIVRRAERRAVSWLFAEAPPESMVVVYLNRLSDYLYLLARAIEGEWVPSRPPS